MTGDTSTLTVSDPAAYARQTGIKIETDRFGHPDPNRCEREIAHVTDGEVRDRTHHVLFAATTADAITAKVSFGLRWYDCLPEWFDAERAGPAADDRGVFIDG